MKVAQKARDGTPFCNGQVRVLQTLSISKVQGVDLGAGGRVETGHSDFHTARREEALSRFTVTALP